jgi:uncharacterized integral membrane protein
MRFKLALILVLACLTLVFMAQNVLIIKLRFLFWGLSMHLSLFAFLLFAIGAAAGWLLHSYSQHRRERKKE